MGDLRVVHIDMAGTKVVIGSRIVSLDADGVSEPLTAEEHALVCSIPGFVAEAEWLAGQMGLPGARRPTWEDQARAEQMALRDESRGKAAPDGESETVPGEPAPDVAEEPVLEGEALLEAVKAAFAGDSETDHVDLFDLWPRLPLQERIDLVADSPFGDEHLLGLAELEAGGKNSKRALEAIELQRGRIRPKATAESINQSLFIASAGGVTAEA